MDIKGILAAAVKHGASDIHIVPLRPPFFRINGKMTPLNGPPMSNEQTQETIFSALPPPLVEKFKKEKELDTSIDAEGIGRFRVNVLEQKDGVGAVLRVIATDIPTPDKLSLEQTLIDLTNTPRGLILVTGPTGSGKSTTLACMINVINTTRHEHILTIEDPIEYVYPKGNCVITQREMGTHSSSFQQSLKRALRQDPDIVLIGEMRDLETIGAALTLAETGHLVFGTLHTTDAAQTVDRIIDVFPPFQQQQIRTQLSVTLRAVVCQQLIGRADGTGRVAAREIMILTTAIANLIRDGKTHQIYSAIDIGSQQGMKSLDRHLAELAKQKMITMDSAISKANNPELVKRLVQGGPK